MKYEFVYLETACECDSKNDSGWEATPSIRSVAVLCIQISQWFRNSYVIAAATYPPMYPMFVYMQLPFLPKCIMFMNDLWRLLVTESFKSTLFFSSNAKNTHVRLETNEWKSGQFGKFWSTKSSWILSPYFRVMLFVFFVCTLWDNMIW